MNVVAVLAIVLPLGLTLLAAPARAECGKEEAVQIAEQAKSMEVDAPAEAARLYAEALACDGNPVINYFRGRTLERIGRLVEAREEFKIGCAFTLPADASDSWRKHTELSCDAQREVTTRIPKLTWAVTANGDPTVTVDGKAVTSQPLALDPGPHTIEANVGTQKANKNVTLVEGKDEHVTLVIATRDDEPPPDAATPSAMPWDTLAYLGFAVAGAGALTWGVAGGVFLSRKGDLDAACAIPEQCSETALIDDTKLAGTVSTVGLVVFAVGAAAGATFLILDATSGDDGDTDSAGAPDDVTLSVTIGPGSLSGSLRF